MKVTIRRSSEEIVFEGEPDQIQRAISSARLDPQTLALDDPRRYQETGRIGNYGERAAVDVRTGRDGAIMMESLGIGFVPGASVREDGRIEYAHPWDRPLQGWRA